MYKKNCSLFVPTYIFVYYTTSVVVHDGSIIILCHRSSRHRVVIGCLEVRGGPLPHTYPTTRRRLWMNGLGRDRHSRSREPFCWCTSCTVYIKYAPARCKTHALINGIIFIIRSIKSIIIIIVIVLLLLLLLLYYNHHRRRCYYRCSGIIILPLSSYCDLRRCDGIMHQL